MSTSIDLQKIAMQHYWGWTIGQLAMYHDVSREEMQRIVGEEITQDVWPKCKGCGEPFLPRRPDNLYCTKQCQDRAAYRRKQQRCDKPMAEMRKRIEAEADNAKKRKRAGESAAIVKSPTKPARVSKMTDSEFSVSLAKQRALLDRAKPLPGDRLWRQKELQDKRNRGWTIGQIARYYGLNRDEVKWRIGDE